MLPRQGIGWLAAALCAAGCAVYTSSVRSDATVDAGSAYLYGRFFMNALPDESGGKQSMGLVIRCQSGSTYTFGSRDKRDVQVLEIRPSRCWVAELVLADQNGMVRKQVKAEPAMQQRQLDFTAGRAHYIGDYFAKGDSSVERAGWTTENHWEWAMSPAAGDRYQETTTEMKRRFPNLASLPTDDLRLIPEAERKRGNGIGPSPGEPPTSPARVARLAPFIRRSYATPAQCEAACPTGQCLPYRGESGPAMACVIRCNRNSDCPTGKGCNCPNSESGAGPGCHPIAATPKDPMDRICLAPETAGESR
jgi:hypothetical protein